MFAPAIDKKQSAGSILGRIDADASPIFSRPKSESRSEDAGHRFKYDFIGQRILEVNKELKVRENPRTLLEIGDLYLLRGNYKKSIKHYERALKLDPTLVQANQKIITAYLTHGKFEEANEYYSVLLETRANDENLLYSYAVFKAFIDISPENTKEATKLLDRIIKQNPKNFEAINSYGMIVLNFLHKPQEAKEYFERVHVINPSYIHAVNNLGVCYLREGNFKEAEKLFKAVIEQEPFSYQLGYQNLCNAYIQAKKYEPALKLLQEAKQKGVILERALEHKIGWLLLTLGHFNEAITWHLKTIEVESKNDTLYNNLGVCFKASGDYENAEKNFIKAVDLFRNRSRESKIILIDHLKCLYNLGQIAVDKRDRQLLEQMYGEILAIHPEDPYGLYLKASRFTIDNNYKEARPLYERSLELTHDIAQIYPDYSFILTSIDKNHSKAIEVLLDAQKKGINTVNIENNLAFAYIQNNELSKAEKILSKYKLNKMPPMLVPTKGLLEFRKGNLEAGNKYYGLAYDSLEEGGLKKLVKQIHLYEQARYWSKAGENEKALSAIREGLSLPSSYATNDLENLKKEIS